MSFPESFSGSFFGTRVIYKYAIKPPPTERLLRTFDKDKLAPSRANTIPAASGKSITYSEATMPIAKGNIAVHSASQEAGHTGSSSWGPTANNGQDKQNSLLFSNRYMLSNANNTFDANLHVFELSGLSEMASRDDEVDINTLGLSPVVKTPDVSIAISQVSLFGDATEKPDDDEFEGNGDEDAVTHIFNPARHDKDDDEVGSKTFNKSISLFASQTDIEALSIPTISATPLLQLSQGLIKASNTSILTYKDTPRMSATNSCNNLNEVSFFISGIANPMASPGSIAESQDYRDLDVQTLEINSTTSCSNVTVAKAEYLVASTPIFKRPLPLQARVKVSKRVDGTNENTESLFSQVTPILTTDDRFKKRPRISNADDDDELLGSDEDAFKRRRLGVKINDPAVEIFLAPNSDMMDDDNKDVIAGDEEHVQDVQTNRHGRSIVPKKDSSLFPPETSEPILPTTSISRVQDLEENEVERLDWDASITAQDQDGKPADGGCIEFVASSLNSMNEVEGNQDDHKTGSEGNSPYHRKDQNLREPMSDNQVRGGFENLR